MRVLGWVVTILLLPSCGDQGQTTPQNELDEPANLACASFSDLAPQMDTLPEKPLHRRLFDVWDNAQLSRTPGIKRSVRELLTAVIGGFPSRIPLLVSEMRQACAGRTSPEPRSD